jgi:hypothetical protein
MTKTTLSWSDLLEQTLPLSFLANCFSLEGVDNRTWRLRMTLKLREFANIG